MLVRPGLGPFLADSCPPDVGDIDHSKERGLVLDRTLYQLRMKYTSIHIERPVAGVLIVSAYSFVFQIAGFRQDMTFKTFNILSKVEPLAYATYLSTPQLSS
jgi:hypothetical protein